MSVVVEHERTAYFLHKERGESDLQRNWFDAEQILVRRLALEFSQRPGANRDPDGNWYSAERFLKWREWVERSGLCRYLAVEAGNGAEAVAASLNEKETSEASLSAPIARCAFILDGAPEYSQCKFELHHGNCRDPKPLVEERDSVFVGHVELAVRLYGGCVLGSSGGRVGSNGSGRLFQDACAAVFKGNAALASAIACCWRLRHELANQNEAERSAWPEEFHLRTVIGTTWDSVVPAVPAVMRDQMLVETTVVNQLSRELRQVLLADGMLIFNAGFRRETSGS